MHEKGFRFIRGEGNALETIMLRRKKAGGRARRRCSKINPRETSFVWGGGKKGLEQSRTMGGGGRGATIGIDKEKRERGKDKRSFSAHKGKKGKLLPRRFQEGGSRKWGLFFLTQVGKRGGKKPPRPAC